MEGSTSSWLSAGMDIRRNCGRFACRARKYCSGGHRSCEKIGLTKIPRDSGGCKTSTGEPNVVYRANKREIFRPSLWFIFKSQLIHISYDRRQSSDLHIAGGHRPPLQHVKRELWMQCKFLHSHI